MPQTIEVPGQGLVEFPDGMSDDEIVSAIQRTATPAPANPFTPKRIPASNPNAAGGFNYGGQNQPQGGGLHLDGFTRNDLPDSESVHQVLDDLSRPAVPLPKFTVDPQGSKTAAVAKTAANLVISLPEFAESPLGAASIASGTVLPRTVAGLFLADTAKNTVQSAGELGKNWDAMTPAERAAASTELGGQALLAAALAHGATRPGGNAVELARALADTKPTLPASVEIPPLTEPVPEWARNRPVQTPERPAENLSAPSEPLPQTPPATPPQAEVATPAPSTAPAALDSRLLPVELTDKEIEAMRPAVQTERAPDVLDDIEAVAGGAVKFDAPDFGQAIADARATTFTKTGKPSASTQRLDQRISTQDGVPADEVLKGLAAENPKYADWTPDDLANAIIASHNGRETGGANTLSLARQLAEEQKRTQLFEATALKPRANAEPFLPEQLFVGDEFTVGGQPNRVTGFATDADTGRPYAVELEGAYGRQSVPIGQALHIDAGSLKDANAPGRVAASGTSAPRTSAARGGGKPKQPGTPTAPTVRPAQPIPLPPTVAPLPAPQLGPIRQWLQNAGTGFNRVFSPHAMDNHASVIANILRDVNGEKANKLSQADEAMHALRKEFDTTPVPTGYKYSPGQPLPHNYAIIDALERNRTALPPRYQSLAKYFDDAFAQRIATIRQFAPHALQNLIADYFPHIWENPKRAQGVMQQVATKLMAGKKEFLKQRTLPFFTDGLARGLKPISDNPVDLLLAKMHSMDKFIAFLKWADEAKKLGELKFKYALEETPEGWRQPAKNDPAFNVFAPPEVTVKEAFDAQLRTRTFELLQKLGVKHSRLASLGGQRWGLAYERPEQIKTRFAGPESVYWHELGHILDFRYNLQNSFLKQGKQFDTELRALADKRIPANAPRTKAVYNKATGKTQNRPTSFASYVRKAEEKMAVMAEAYVHAPELFQKTAPTVYRAFDKFIEDHPELHDIRNIKPSLRLDTAEIQQKLPGTLKMGEWIMRDGPAQVVENYLSPGLSNSAVYRSVRSASNLLNAAQLGLSAFHVGFTSLDAVVNAVEVGLYRGLRGDFKGAGKVLVNAPIAPVQNYLVGKAVQRAMLDPQATHAKILGLKVPISQLEQQVAALAVKGGLRATTDPFWQTHMTRNLVRAVHEGGLAWAKTPLYAPMALVEQLMRPISEYLVPRQKLGVFALLAKSELDRLPPGADVHTVRAAMARAADATEDRMGQMTYDNLFYNRMAKDLALISFRAYGWQLGKYRHLFGAAADTVASAKRIAAGKMPELTHRQVYFLALPLVVGAIGGVLHRMFTGQNPDDWKDYLHPATGQLDANGNPKRLSLPSYLKDIESDISGLFKGWKTGGLMGAAQGGWMATYHRLNPGLSIAVDMLNNRDFFGTQIWNPDDSHMQQLGAQAAFIAKSMTPFSITGAIKLNEGEASTRDKMLPFIGITPAKHELTMTPLESYYSEQFRNLMPAGTKTPEQSEMLKLRSKLVTDLRTAKASGQGVDNLPARLMAAGVKNEQALTRLAQKAEYLPIQYQAKYLPLTQAMRGYDLASDKEKASLATVLMPRIQSSWERDQLDDETTSRYVKQLVPFYKPAPENP